MYLCRNINVALKDGRIDTIMLLEEQRYLHEDLERLEQAIAQRVSEEPKLVSKAKKIETRNFTNHYLVVTRAA